MNIYNKKNIEKYLLEQLHKNVNKKEIEEDINEKTEEYIQEEQNEDIQEEEQNNNYTENRNISAYQQLSNILNELKSNKVSINDAMNKIQLKDSKPLKPYCKVTSNGALALYGISKQPIVLYPDQWNKLLKISKTNYIENYMSYNESRLKYKKNNFRNNF
jgi:hypothetical protein